MAREGTRSQTGHSKPRIFETVDTAPVTQRKKTTTTKPAAKKATAAPATKGSKPTGVTKKTAPKKDGPVAKAKSTANKVEKKVEKKVEEAKPKKTATTKTTKPKTVAK